MSARVRLYIWVMGFSWHHCETCSSNAGTVGTLSSFAVRPGLHDRCHCKLVPVGWELAEEEQKEDEREKFWTPERYAAVHLRMGEGQEQASDVYPSSDVYPEGETSGLVGLEVSPNYGDDQDEFQGAIGSASVGVEVESMTWELYDEPDMV